MERTDIFGYTLEQLNTVVDTLIKESLARNDAISANTKQKLEKVLFDVERFGDTTQLQILLVRDKLRAVLFFVDKHYDHLQKMITFGTFAESDFKIIREMYKEAELAIRGNTLQPKAPILYPASIDPRDADGIPGTINEYLENHYKVRRATHKSLKARKLVEMTGLSEEVIQAKFDLYRGIWKAKQKEKEKKQKKEEEHNFHIYQRVLRTYNFPFLPSPPMTRHDRFPLHRIPLNEPLFIEIP
ncbi:unnamed protein product [Caenorhabditis sp. 36 PRJEB53466]|nr:unnamed protein product [Caenorhabditis sp. 36 PRJEB53466]